jgi:hypothetical protein
MELSELESVRCPRCGVEPGEPCLDLRSLSAGRQIANFKPHAERIAAARRTARAGDRPGAVRRPPRGSKVS